MVCLLLNCLGPTSIHDNGRRRLAHSATTTTISQLTATNVTGAKPSLKQESNMWIILDFLTIFRIKCWYTPASIFPLWCQMLAHIMFTVSENTTTYMANTNYIIWTTSFHISKKCLLISKPIINRELPKHHLLCDWSSLEITEVIFSVCCMIFELCILSLYLWMKKYLYWWIRK